MSRLNAFILFLLLLFVSLPLAGETPAADDKAVPGPVLVLGDSLSADYGFDRRLGWTGLLEARLLAEGDARGVVNAAISGDTTRSGRARLPDLLERHSPSIVILQLGGNDGLRGLPVEEARRNLAAMIEAAREAEARVLLVGVRLPPNYGRPYTEAFAGMYEALAEEAGIQLVPRILEGVAERESLMQSDGIHPTAEAQPIILDNLWPALKALLDETQAGSAN